MLAKTQNTGLDFVVAGDKRQESRNDGSQGSDPEQPIQHDTIGRRAPRLATSRNLDRPGAVATDDRRERLIDESLEQNSRGHAPKRCAPPQMGQ